MKIHKKKIAFVIGALTPGGAERVISTLSNQLIEKFEVTIFTFTKSNPFYRLDSRIKIIPCFDKIEKPKSIFHSLRLNYSLVKRLTTLVNQEKVNLLIGFITSANIIATIAAKFNRIPCLISERNDPLKKDIPRLWLLLRKRIYPMANNLIVQTERVKNIYTKMLKSKRITVLANPISSDLSKLRTNNPIRKKIILSVGRLNDDKRQDKIINAVHDLGLKEWKVLLIGNGPNKDKLNALIKSYNLTHQIKILSGIKDIHNYYSEASIFVFTSKAEGFPNALLEAQYFGLPCISTDCNYGPSELITDGVNGFLVPVNDQEVLKQRMQQLINDKNLQEQFSKKGKENTENFTSGKVTAKWEALINNYI
ncbi:glycosyltransferase family 4 protein [Winogradskyella vidalii]|uniref:glycosyltransferase family 4 protein n=1 Tax=Winogradskyella vidalii TaxID=2615024 RepID=UPI0015C6D06F|nr:glycosyltransferase family 4 protein [Winogradskyella vidalii]